MEKEIAAWLLSGQSAIFYYSVIFFLMFLESSFFPFPSEVVMIPAGYLAFSQKLNLGWAIFWGISGSVAGAWLNYFLADKFGRRLLLKFLKEKHLIAVEKFFAKHGHVSTFSGRLLPVVRQYISFPAGLARMHPGKFTFYTALGAGIWVSFLAGIGYFVGWQQKVWQHYLYWGEAGIAFFLLLFFAFYFFFLVRRRGK